MSLCAVVNFRIPNTIHVSLTPNTNTQFPLLSLSLKKWLMCQ